ncbi:MAG: D-glycero-beta-D-manno-heptose-7-phosphate kinase [Ideonella sp.]|nr:D-glycero-beta-D-manno-heptose-7-phosphate kinase [Ideonella sp.]MCC7457957.1 D-glycero-beta-D-manno-heptose-7-phosphate kinase [Nitrospira sp.]
MNAVAVDRARVEAARVLVVGDAMLDRYWFGAVDRISPEAPVPVVLVQREEERLGGAANVALNVRRLGAQASLLTVLGDDEPARAVTRLLKHEGVRGVIGRDPALRTTIKLRVVGRSQQLLRVDFENRPDHELLAQMLDEFRRVLPAHDAVLFSDYGKGGLAHIGRMIELARAAGKPVLVDPKGRDFTRYAGASVITPNRGELAQAAGPWSDEDALTAISARLRRECRLDALLLTRSEEGMTLFDSQGALSVPAQARQVFDVTGAGDTVIATMAAMMAAGLGAREAMPIANRAAGIVVSRFGTASVSYDELFGAAA